VKNVGIETSARTRVGPDLAGALLLAVLGIGVRITFAAVFPAQPFWDSLQLVHFGVLLRDQGLSASGWYWGQFNAGLPVVLSLLFRSIGGDPIAVARTATAVATTILSYRSLENRPFEL
jgi:hypothetical protein